MLRPEIIRKRLDKLNEYLAFLEGMRSYTLEEFLGNPEPLRQRRTFYAVGN